MQVHGARPRSGQGLVCSFRGDAPYRQAEKGKCRQLCTFTYFQYRSCDNTEPGTPAPATFFSKKPCVPIYIWLYVLRKCGLHTYLFISFGSLTASEVLTSPEVSGRVCCGALLRRSSSPSRRRPTMPASHTQLWSLIGAVPCEVTTPALKAGTRTIPACLSTP